MNQILKCLALTLFVAGSLVIAGCIHEDEGLDSKVEQTIEKSINGQTYRFESDRVTQLSSDGDNTAIYGVISDAHGEVEKARLFAQLFKEKGVDGIIVTGDIPLNEQLRYGRIDSKNDQDEIIDVLEAIAESQLPIFVIPGNHENRSDYENAISELSEKYDNIIDMAKYRVFDGDDVDFVSLPGYQTFKIPGKQFIPLETHQTQDFF